MSVSTSVVIPFGSKYSNAAIVSQFEKESQSSYSKLTIFGCPRSESENSRTFRDKDLARWLAFSCTLNLIIFVTLVPLVFMLIEVLFS